VGAADRRDRDRVTLGAQPRDIMRLVIRQGMRSLRRPGCGSLRFGARARVAAMLVGVVRADPLCMRATGFTVLVTLARRRSRLAGAAGGRGGAACSRVCWTRYATANTFLELVSR